MSGTLAAIFGLPGSKKWIALEGRAGDLAQGVGGSDGEGGEEVLGATHGPDASSGSIRRV